MSLEASIQSLADAVREFAKIYGEQTAQVKANFVQAESTEVKATKPPKSKSVAPAAEPVAAPTPVTASAPEAATALLETPPPTTQPATAAPDPFATDTAPKVTTYDDVVAALRSLSDTPGKGRDAVIAVLAKFGAKTVPELATKADVSLDAVLAAAKAAMA